MFLKKFQKDGFYLIDAFERPMPDGADLTTKKRMIRSTLPQLRRKVSRLCLRDNVPVVLISHATYTVCAQELRADGIRTLNTGFVKSPGARRAKAV